MMKAFKRGEKGFTLVELLIVVAILGILAAVVIPNVVGLLGRGGRQAYNTDLKTVQLAAATFFADTHGGWSDNTDDDGADDDDPGNATGYVAGRANFDANQWNQDVVLSGHYYPTSIGTVTNHVLVINEGVPDPDTGAPRVDLSADAGGGAAINEDIDNHSIWMGLLINAAGDEGTSLDARIAVAPLSTENALYLNEIPKSCMPPGGSELYNGNTPSTGGYCWIVGKNGVVYGVYGVTAGGVTTWYAGYSGAYP